MNVNQERVFSFNFQGEDAADAKKRHQLLVSEILHRYVEHARTHDKLLGIRSALDVRDS